MVAPGYFLARFSSKVGKLKQRLPLPILSILGAIEQLIQGQPGE